MLLSVLYTATTSLCIVVNTVFSTMDGTGIFIYSCIYLFADSQLFGISALIISVLECMTGKRGIKNQTFEIHAGQIIISTSRKK